MQRRYRRFAAVIGLALGICAALTSCGGSSSSTRPTTTAIPQETVDQIARQSASLVGPGGALATAYGLVNVFLPTTSEARGTGPFRTVQVDSDSSSLSSTLRIYDLTGQEVGLGTVTVDQIGRAVFAWDLYLQHTSDSLSYLTHSTETIDITGFPTAQPRWSFSGSGSWAWNWDIQASGFRGITHLLGQHQFDGVAFEKSGAPTYPVAGSVALQWNVSWDHTVGSQHSAGAQTVSSTLAFDGSRYALLTVDGTHRYTVDLVTGELVSMTTGFANAAR